MLKILAFVYGIACVAFAFLADLIGTGVLQVQDFQISVGKE